MYYKYVFKHTYTLTLTLILVSSQTFCSENSKSKKTHVETIQQLLPPKEIQKLIADYLSDEWIKDQLITTQSPVSRIAFSSDSKILGVTDGHHARLWKLADKNLIQSIPLHDATISTYLRNLTINMKPFPLAFSPDGKYLATKDDYIYINIWQNVNNKYILKQKLKAYLNIHSLAFSPDSQSLAAGQDNEIVYLWKYIDNQFTPAFFWTYKKTGNLSANSEPIQMVCYRHGKAIIAGPFALWCEIVEPIHALTFSPDGHYLVYGKNEQISFIKDYTEPSRRTYILNHASPISSIAYSRGGEYMAASTDKIVNIFHNKLKLLKTLKTHSKTVTSVAFSPDGKTLATGSLDGTVKFWDVQNNFTFMHEFVLPATVNALAFSPDGNYFAAAYGSAVQLWQSKAKVLGQDLGLAVMQRKLKKAEPLKQSRNKLKID